MIFFRNKRLLIVAAALAFLLLFYEFSRQVNRGFLKQADFAVTVKIQDHVDKSTRLRLVSVVGNIMEGSTFFASPLFSSITVGLLTLIALYDKKNKKYRPAAILIPILFAALVAGEIYGKSVVHHPSPPFFMVKNPTSVFPKDYVNEQFSYPSGHTARAVYIGIIVLSLISQGFPIVRKNLGTWILTGGCINLYVIVVSVSRIYLGHHWLSDIIGGGLLGSGFSLLAASMLQGKRPYDRPQNVIHTSPL